MEDFAAFARLIEAVRPWLGHLVVVGGWAHRLHRFHPLATDPKHLAQRTRDADLALSVHAPLEGDIGEALERAGFTRRFVGDNRPPVTHYELVGDHGGFYAEFLTSFTGSGLTRKGRPDIAVSRAGVTVQKLRYLELLLIAPWSVQVGPDVGVPLDTPTDVVLANPVSFIIQKLLIHEKRNSDKKAQDVLSIHDTLELFGGSFDALRTIWGEEMRPKMSPKTARTAVKRGRTVFQAVTDTIRSAARIPQDRTLSPERIRAACEYGLGELLLND